MKYRFQVSVYDDISKDYKEATTALRRALERDYPFQHCEIFYLKDMDDGEK